MIPSDCTAVNELIEEQKQEVDSMVSKSRPINIIAVLTLLLTTAVFVFFSMCHMPPQWSRCLQSAIVAILASVLVTVSYCALRHC